MKKKTILMFSLCFLSLVSCNAKNEMQKAIDELNSSGLQGFLGSKLENFKDTLHIRYNFLSDDGSEAIFQFKETRDDGVDVYSFGTKYYLETQFYYRNDIAVGFKTRDPGFGLTIYGYGIDYPAWRNLKQEDGDAELFTTLIQKGFEKEIGKDIWEDDPVNEKCAYSWCLFTFQNKLHVNYSWNSTYSAGYSMRTMEVFLDT